MTVCPGCDAESEKCYRCSECGRDLADTEDHDDRELMADGGQTIDVAEALYQTIEDRTEANVDGKKNANGKLFTGKSYLKQEVSKGNVPCSRDEVSNVVDRLLEEGRIVGWHGLLAPATEEHLKAIIRNERDHGFGRMLFVKKCRELLESKAQRGEQP